MDCGILLMFVSSAIICVTKGDAVKDETVYPERIHHSRSRRDLSTELKEKQHEDTFSIKIDSKYNGEMILDLQKNDEIHPGSLLLRTYDENGHPKHDMIKTPTCYYTGQIRSKKDSYVHLSTCNGLVGTIDNGEQIYDISPVGNDGAHRYHQVDDEIDDIVKKLSKETSVVSPKNEVQDDLEITKAGKGAESVRGYELVNVEKQYLPYLTTNETRYVEMFISVGDGIYKRYNNDSSLVVERILNAVGQVDKSYSAINIRIVVVAMEIQTNGPTFERSASGGGELSKFKDHYNNVIKKASAFRHIRMDNGQFFSHRGWSDAAGMGYVGGVCGGVSAAVNAWSFSSIFGPTVILGHEFGHNLNFPHDGDGCTCLTARGCFMGGPKTSRPGFSDCNLRRLALRTWPCLDDYPQNPITSKCGNGIKEKGEECDCGTPENCLRNDPCCKPYACKLKAESQCSFVNHPECCDKQCQHKMQGTMCREADSNCDVPEYCSGKSSECPLDRTRSDGTPCGESKKLILGTDKYKETRRELTPRVVAQYFRLIPRYWTKDGEACIGLEMLGCDSAEDSSLVPTSISTDDLYYHLAMCLTPDVTDCKGVPDGTSIKYKRTVNNDCSHSYMQFRHEVDGTLIHECSGMKVCPRTDGFIVLSNSCNADNSKYVRTKEWSLKHIKSGKCLMSSDGWPHSGDLVKLSTLCDDLKYRRTKLFFRNVDCMKGLGFRNGKLPDSAFSATDGNDPKMLRINAKERWCPSSKTKPGWVQVDFGKKVEVRYITMKGTYWNWWTAYYLKYSDNGLHWKYYKEAGANGTDMNSNCYRGTCVLTRDHQCQQIWGADTKSASDECWNNLNTMKDKDEYGTCDATALKSCKVSNVKCGQVQCLSAEKEPFYMNYGDGYAYKTVAGKKCSVAKIVGNEQVGLGMVDDGTKCGNGRMCVQQECKTLEELGVRGCPKANGRVCNNKGYCLDNGKCQCKSGYDPVTSCILMVRAIDGQWSPWSTWNACSKACGTGIRRRHRFCNTTIAQHGGKWCVGDRIEEETCNKEPCIVGRTCKDIQRKMENVGRGVTDGVYRIKPTDSLTLDVYCDMTRDDGGWTLIVSSHTNTWTEESVLLRNADSPNMFTDYSILKYGNDLKDSYLIAGDYFQYRLEAHQPGKWGGIWEAPNNYDMASTNSGQGVVELKKKFDDWDYQARGLNNRLPFIDGARITVGEDGWGSITDNNTNYHPSRWIRGDLKMNSPEHVWYWLREGDYANPKSCLDIMFRGFASKPYSSGTYNIEPEPGKPVETFCDFDRHGGGWTLLVGSSGSGGWNPENILSRNANNGMSSEYSIYGLLKGIHGDDVAETSYNYMVEADGKDKNGGIFSLPLTGDNRDCLSSGLTPTLVKRFGNWDVNVESFAKHPICTSSRALLGAMSANSTANGGNKLGVLISGDGKGAYMSSHKKPSSVKVWVRRGGSRKTCNDIKIHGYHKGKTDYKDGFYMVNNSQPVYCDMTMTPKEGWTLLVTSASSGWSKKQVLRRNPMRPSTHHDYSILDQADAMKSLSTATHFKYMLTAQRRGHWGGIWRAPIAYSFTSSDDSRKDVTMVKQFDQWSYNEAWWRGPCKRMPWLEISPQKHEALLTTAGYSDYTSWGSIVANISNHVPAKWIYTEMTSPGVIWYWLNENDCNANYDKVDGKFSVSSWSPCSVFCGGEGVQFRKRKCDNPAPSCGGDPCGPTQELVEKRSCNVPCTVTRILTQHGSSCWEAENKECTPPDGTKIVIRPSSTNCNGIGSSFVFNPNKGEIIHHCSKNKVCFLGKPGSRLLVISSACPEMTDSEHFMLTQFNTIYYGVQVVTSKDTKDGSDIVLKSGGMKEEEKVTLSNRNLAPVKSQYWDGVKTTDFYEKDSRYPTQPTSTGFIDNMETPASLGDNYAMQISSYFKPLESGSYRFRASCDDRCDVYLSESNEASQKKRIIRVTGWTGRYQWDRYKSQLSKRFNLISGKRYYIEARMTEGGGGDHMTIGVDLPDGKFVSPITSVYLASCRTK